MAKSGQSDKSIKSWFRQFMRHPLSYLLRSAFREVTREGSATMCNESRRNFIKQSALLAAGSALVPGLLHAQNKQVKIAIVGAGMAGLNAAYQLKKQGVIADIYEASSRSGGRMFTMKNQFGEGTTTDIGGEFVDTTHEDIIGLMNEMGLPFYDLRNDKLESHAYYFDNRLLTKDELKNALKPYAKKIEADIKSLPKEINHTTASQFQHLDNLSITEYMRQLGINGWLYKLIDVVLTREYGMEASEQSLINFLIMFNEPTDEHGEYTLFGDEHEVFKIKGGSQHLADAVFEKVKHQVKLKHKFTAVKQTGDAYTLSFETATDKKEVVADYVVMAIPFSVLRNIRMDVVMPAEKRTCINELGYGNGSKFVMGIKGKPWRRKEQQGYTFNDLSFGCGWDSTQMQTETNASFTVFGGGNFANHVYETKEDVLASSFIQSLDEIYTGVKEGYTKKNIKYCWARNPYSFGSYTSFKKGQWSTLAGWEAVPVGNMFFAGEHVSLDFQGYMNGAAKTGRIAAEQIIEKINKPKENKVRA